MKYGKENGDYNWGFHRGYPKTLNTKPLNHLTNYKGQFFSPCQPGVSLSIITNHGESNGRQSRKLNGTWVVKRLTGVLSRRGLTEDQYSGSRFLV